MRLSLYQMRHHLSTERLSQRGGRTCRYFFRAALYAAIEVAKRPEFKGKTVVALLPDSGDRYYSTDLFKD